MAKGNFIEYVISDNPNKYPNENEQDGYYYRKVTKVETEEQIVTAGTTPIEVIPSQGKLISKVNINPTPTEEKTVTPTTENLIVAPVEGKQLSQVTVQGDANFLEENIKSGVTIWGKTGTHICSGQHVWKRGNYIPGEISIENAQMSISSTKGTKNFQITSASFDLDLLTEENYQTLLLELFKSSDGNSYFEIKNSKLAFHYVYSNNEGTSLIESYDPTTHMLITSVNLFHTGTYTLSNSRTVLFESTIRNFVDFIISDNESAYPDDGDRDGYWYKKVQNI